MPALSSIQFFIHLFASYYQFTVLRGYSLGDYGNFENIFSRKPGTLKLNDLIFRSQYISHFEVPLSILILCLNYL